MVDIDVGSKVLYQFQKTIMSGQRIDKPPVKDGTVLTLEFLASYSLSNL